MRARLQRFAGYMAAQYFLHAPQGWLFRAPIPWTFGRRPLYLVDERQKAKIERIAAAGHVVICLFLLLSVAWSVLYPTAGLRFGSSSVNDNHVLTFMLSCMLFAALHHLYEYLAFRSLLKRLPRATARQTTLAEKLEDPASRLSTRYIGIFFMLLLVLLAFSAYPAIAPRSRDVYSVISAIMTGCLVVYVGAVLWVKVRWPRQT
jgi:hypothetical protein